MNENVAAVTNLEHDLRAAGVSSRAMIPTIFYYISALQNQGNAAWGAFYRSVHSRLIELTEREVPYVGPAAEPLLRLLDDDFGATLISAGERQRIRARLVEYGTREASLSS